MAFIRYLIIILAASLACSCDKQKPLISQAENLVMERPRDALTILNSVDVRLLTEYQYTRFIMLRALAKGKSGQDISTDTVVFEARDYFISKEKTHDAAMACFVAAMVYEFQEKTTISILQYREAAQWANKTDDYLLSGFIFYNMARLYYLQYLYSESISCLKQAIKYEKMANQKTRYRIYTLELVGLNYLFLERSDSSLIYYNMVMDLSLQINDTLIQRRTLQNLSVTYRELGYYQEAKRKCRQSFAITNVADSIETGKLNLILGDIYIETEQYDSATIYLSRAQNLLVSHKDPIDMAGLYKLLSFIEEKNNNPEKALQYKQVQKAYEKSLKHTNQRIQEEQEKYRDNKMQVLQEQRNVFLLQMQRVGIMSVSMLVVLLVMGFSYRYQMKMKKEVRQEIAEKEKLKELVDKEITEKENLKEIIEEDETERDHLRKEVCHAWLLFYFQQVKASSELKKLLDGREAIKAVRHYAKEMATSIQWEDLYWFINEFYTGLPERIKVDLDLSEKNFQACVLSYAGWDSANISTLMDESPNTSLNRRNELRKTLGIEARGSFQKYLDQKYGLNTEQQSSTTLRKEKPRW